MVPEVKETTFPSGGSVIATLSIVKFTVSLTLHTSPGLRGLIDPSRPANSVYLIVFIAEEASVKSKTLPLPFDVKPKNVSPAVYPIVGVPVFALIVKVLIPDIVSPGT